MREIVTVLADIEHGSERKTVEFEQERAGYYVTIVIDELAFRSAIENDDGSIPDDGEEIIRRVHRDSAITEYEAREYYLLAERYKSDSLRWALALAKALEDKQNNDYD